MKVGSKLPYEELQIKFDFCHGWPPFFMSYSPLFKIRFPDFSLLCFHISKWVGRKLPYEVLQIKFDFRHGWPTFPWVIAVFIRPTCRDVLWYGAGVCPSVRLSTKLVNTIQTEPFELGLSNLVHLLLMTRGWTLLIFKVRGQRSRSHATHCYLTL